MARAAPVEPAVLPTYPGRGVPASPPMMEGRTMATGNAVLWQLAIRDSAKCLEKQYVFGNRHCCMYLSACKYQIAFFS